MTDVVASYRRHMNFVIWLTCSTMLAVGINVIIYLHVR
jgi:hypothetical protein